ncbi:MAG: MOSC domain-containing protein [Salinivirgaceae bacterium]|jgi:MOSC domain-containing protein YiiM
MNTICKVISVNISEKKGTIKTPRKVITLNQLGVENDAHAGDWHRQVSLLAVESIHKFEKKLGRQMEYGEFAENITTQGIVLYETIPGDRFLIGQTELEVTQIGKKCHGDGCQIFQIVGSCVMPKEGIFCKVIKGGSINPDDYIEYIKRS